MIVNINDRGINYVRRIRKVMKAYLLFSACEPVLVLTTYDLGNDPEAVKKVADKTVNKFIAYEISIDAVKNSYSAHFTHVLKDPLKEGEVKVLDDDGRQIFNNLKLKDLVSGPIFYDP
jgi:hypothetical protein